MPATTTKPYLPSEEHAGDAFGSRKSMSPRAIKMRAKKAQREEQARAHKEHTEKARAIVATGKCPCCKAGLRPNLAIAGWWQCEQYGAPGFRKDASKPACNWQIFTE